MNFNRKFFLCILLSFICGFLEVFGISATGELSECIDLLALGSIYSHVQFIPEIIFRYIPLLLFQVIYGTELYKDFCISGIYYFSRSQSRIRWALPKLLFLFLVSAFFILSQLFGALLSASTAFGKGIRCEFPWKIVFYFVIYTLFLFSSTVWINGISICRNSMIGFVVFEALIMSSIIIFTIYGTVTSDYYFQSQSSWFIRMTPAYHLAEAMKINISDYVEASVFFGAASLMAIVFLLVAVTRHEFYNSNQEAEEI